jgi:alginate O-acetyltransferase complex protein AlgI
MFRADNMKYAWDYLMNMFGLLNIHTNEIVYGLPYYIDTIEVITFIAAILCSIPLFNKMLEVKNKIGLAIVNMWLLVLFVLSVATIASSTYNPFIYFRF